MSKWTEEPWEVKWDYNVFGPNERLVAFLNIKDEEPENKANARLISMAPTMAREIKNAVNWLDKYLDNGNGDLGELHAKLAETLRRLEE